MGATTDPGSLVDEAAVAADSAYAPYSRFRVGAVVVAADGRHFGGSNVENAAYGTTLCAEANAIGTAISAGARRLEVIAVASPDGTDVFPCGNCRQLMNEFGVETVIVVADDGRPREYAMAELMPYAFGPEDLPGSDEG